MTLEKTFSRAARKATTAAAFALALAGGLPANNNFIPAAQAQTAQAPQAICVAKADMGKWLTDNGQYVLIGADLPVWNQTTHTEEKQRNVFTGDETLQTGYHFRQHTADSFCTFGKISEIKLFDARKNRIDPRVFRGTIPANVNGGIAQMLDKSKLLGEFPALQAKIQFNNDNRVFMTTILLNPSSGEGSFDSMDSNGKLIPGAGGGLVQNASYSKVALATLDKPVQTAPAVPAPKP